MKKLRLDLVIVIVCALMLGLLTFERSTTENGEPLSVFSTYDTGPNGYRALYEVLGTAKVPVRRFQRELVTLDPSIRTLVVTGYEDDLSRNPLGQHDADAIKEFVLGGGRFVAIDTEFAGPQDITPGVGTTLRNGGGDAVALARDGLTAGVARVSGPIDWSFPFRERGVPLLANGQGVVAVWYPYGRGDVIAITAPAIFGNEWLRNAENLRFAYNVLAGHGSVAFDEYVHGYSDNLSMWAALPPAVRAAVWVVLALAVIALIGANVPFAPPFLTEAPDERDSSDYIGAIAELMRRSHRRPSDEDVIWEAQVDFRRRKEHA
jgi:hypothetical protein